MSVSFCVKHGSPSSSSSSSSSASSPPPPPPPLTRHRARRIPLSPLCSLSRIHSESFSDRKTHHSHHHHYNRRHGRSFSSFGSIRDGEIHSLKKQRCHSPLSDHKTRITDDGEEDENEIENEDADDDYDNKTNTNLELLRRRFNDSQAIIHQLEEKERERARQIRMLSNQNKCPVCLNYLFNPQELSCGHFVCHICLSVMMNSFIETPTLVPDEMKTRQVFDAAFPEIPSFQDVLGVFEVRVERKIPNCPSCRAPIRVFTSFDMKSSDICNLLGGFTPEFDCICGERVKREDADNHLRAEHKFTVKFMQQPLNDPLFSFSFHGLDQFSDALKLKMFEFEQEHPKQLTCYTLPLFPSSSLRSSRSVVFANVIARYTHIFRTKTHFRLSLFPILKQMFSFFPDSVFEDIFRVLC